MNTFFIIVGICAILALIILANNERIKSWILDYILPILMWVVVIGLVVSFIVY